MTTSVLNEWKRIAGRLGMVHSDVEPAIEAAGPLLRKALTDDPVLAVRAVQVLNLAAQGLANSKHCACQKVGSVLAENGPLLVREPVALGALILAAWLDGAGKLAGLLESSWEELKTGGDWEGEIGEWRGRVLGGRELGNGGELVEWTSPAEPPSQGREVGNQRWATLEVPYWEARAHLEGGRGSAWKLSSFGAQLLVILQALRIDMRALAMQRLASQIVAGLDGLQDSFEWLHSNQGGGHTFQGEFSTHLNRILVGLSEVLDSTIEFSVKGSSLSYLTGNPAAGWQYNNYSSQLLSVIDRLKDGVLLGLVQHFNSQVQTQETRLQTYTSDLSTSLKNYTTRLSHQIENSRPQELELLWWGQAGYCHQRRTPYRKLQKAPDLLWLAAREAADRAVKLSAEPAAAFLVNTVARMDQDLSEEKTVLEWMQADYTMLRPQRNTTQPSLQPSEKLKSILEDPACLPISWLRQQVVQGDEPTGEALRNKVAIDPDKKLDRGDWLTWIFRELLLERRLG